MRDLFHRITLFFFLQTRFKRKMTLLNSLIPVLVLSTVLVVSNVDAYECPGFCQCRSTSIIQCDGAGIAKETLENLFKTLPMGVIFFKLTNTNLTTLDTKLFSTSFMKLTQLDLEKNKLTEVPTNLSGVFPSLQRLKLPKNQIAELKNSNFVGLTKLTLVDIQRNKLTQVESGVFASNSKLEQIYLSSNNIETISEGAFNGLKALKTLRINENKIKSLKKGVFEGLPKVQLSLAKNSIERIEDGLFKANQSFSFLDLNENMIKQIDEMAFAKVSINVLTIDKNKLESFPVTLFESIKSVSLADNPLKCDCHMAKVVEYLYSESRLNRIVGSCQSPDNMKGVNLKDVNLETVRADFECTVCDFNNTCLNGGKCMAINNKVKCECPSDYEGDNCEDKVPPPSPVPKADDSGEEDDSTTYIIVAVVVLVILLVLAVGTCYCMRSRKTPSAKGPEDSGGDTLLKTQGADAGKEAEDTTENS